MKQYRRLIEPAAILLLVISAILPGWLSIAAGASALILLIALAASHFTGKKRLAVVVGLVAVLAVVFYINGQRNAKVQAGDVYKRQGLSQGNSGPVLSERHRHHAGLRPGKVAV